MDQSPSIQSGIEQNRSSQPLEIRYWPIDLPQSLPVKMHYPHEHADDPIRMLHVHNCWELGYCFEGGGIFMVGSKVMSFSAGTVSLIGPDEPHFAQSLPGTTSRWAWVYFNPAALLCSMDAMASCARLDSLRGTAFANLLDSGQAGYLGRRMRELVDELKADHTDQSAMVRAMVTQITLNWLRQHADLPQQSDDATGHTGSLMQRLAPAMTYLASHYAQHLCVDKLAEMCDLSESHFRRLFREALGQSPQAYWLSLRIGMAASLLLSTDQAILPISQQVGFETLSSFNRAFKQNMGVSPSAWRRDAATATD